jgi:hypothetical protein
MLFMMVVIPSKEADPMVRQRENATPFQFHETKRLDPVVRQGENADRQHRREEEKNDIESGAISDITMSTEDFINHIKNDKSMRNLMPRSMRNLIPRKSVGGQSPFRLLSLAMKKIPSRKNRSVSARSTFISEAGPHERLKSGAEWPEGWTKRIHQRKNGASKGRKDCYWITPKNRCRLRSMKEVENFFVALEATDGDEIRARETMKNH